MGALKKILLSGYYGFGNAGDEAILQASAAALQQNGASVAVLSHKPDETAATLGTQAYGRKKFSNILSAIRRSDLILSGGGGLFQDTTSFKSLFYYVRIPVLAKLLGKKTMVFAQGIGPIESRIGKLLTRLVCNSFVDCITVRDIDSKTLLESLGVTRAIEVTADLAFLLQPPTSDQIKKTAQRFKLDATKTPLAGIVLRDWPGMNALAPEIAKAVSNFSKNYGVTPVLLSFQAAQEQGLLNLLDTQLTVPHLTLREALSPQDLLGLVSSFALVMGMRYHSLVFAAQTGVPFVGIGYDPKVIAFARFLQFPLVTLENLSTAHLETELSGAWQQLENLRKVLEEKTVSLRKKAWNNIDLALALLEGK